MSAKIGRFGPIVQIGTAEDEEKPRFASLRKNQSIETITLEEALELFKLPRDLGEYEGKVMSVGVGRFGAYVKHDGKYVSLKKTDDPLDITPERAIELIEEKREQERNKFIKVFEAEGIEICNGRFGPYIAYNGANYKIPKSAVPADLTVEECQKLIEEQGEKKPARRARAAATKTTAAKSTASEKKSTAAKKSTTTKSAKKTTTKKAK